MMNATLPDSLISQTIRDVILGETVYVVPWAMFATTDSRLWLRGEYSFHNSPGGTVQLKITRVGGGFNVDRSQCQDYSWRLERPQFAYIEAPIPVVELK